MDTIYSLKLPPKNYRRTIEELSVVIPDPVLKLKFLKQAINEHQKISAHIQALSTDSRNCLPKKAIE